MRFLAGWIGPHATDRDLARRGRNHDGIDLAKYDVDATGDARHNRSGSHRNKSSHQRVLDKILAATIAPDPRFQGPSNYLQHHQTAVVEVHG